MDWLRNTGCTLLVCASLTLAACDDSDDSPDTPPAPPVTVLQTQGTQWVHPDGAPIVLKGTNLGNWLLNEFWMMGQTHVPDQCTLEATFTSRFGAQENERLMDLFRDNWITARDWDLMKDFGLNVVRLPFSYTLLEDDAHPKQLRADAWQYLDDAIRQAESRRMYVILDLHGAAGSQGREHHSGCQGRNWFWDGGNGQPASFYQDRTTWLWQQIAQRYRGRSAVAAYGLLNEPWGTDATTLATYIKQLYSAIRSVDPDHIIILPGHNSGIDAYGDPAAAGMKNVAFEMHFYPGIFGWGQIGYGVHRDWLLCGPAGTTGVCEWRDRINRLNTPFIIGEMQPWTGQGDLGGQITRATYDRYGSLGWATTNWSYKVFTNGGGQGAGTWGMVTNASTQEVLVKANTWDCDNWDATFGNACNTRTSSVRVGGDGTPRALYLVVKTGACCNGALDVVVDSISLINDVTGEEVVVNGGFGSDTGWTQWNINGAQTFDFNYAADTPAAGSGPGLRVSGGADNNGGVYQAVTLQSGQTYTLRGAFKDIGSQPQSAWAEVYLVAAQPQTGVDIVGTALPDVDFASASLEDIEALFRSFGTLDYDVHLDLKHWLTSSTPPELLRKLPATPTGLTLVDNGTSAQLSWNANTETDLTGYNVYRATVLGAYNLLASGVTTPSYTDNTIVDGLPYFYVVAATDKDGDKSFLSAAANIEGEPMPIPGAIEAENFVAMSGVQTEGTTDAGGGLNVGFLDPGDWFEYTVNVQAAGNYTVEYRVASEPGSPGGFQLLANGTVIDSQSIAATGGWQAWTTITSTVALQAGEQTLRFNAVGGSWNLNKLTFTGDGL
jgi:endoglucanase